MEITGRYKIEIVPKLYLQKRHTQLYLIKETDDVLNILNTFYKESLHPRYYDCITCGHSINDLWSIQNLQRFLKYHNGVELLLIYKHKDTMKVQFVPHSSKNQLISYVRTCKYPGDYKQDIFRDVVGISLVFLKDKEEIRGIKRKLKGIVSKLSFR